MYSLILIWCHQIHNAFFPCFNFIGLVVLGMAGDSAVSSSSENYFDLQVLLEPWPEENCHVQRNRRKETSLRQRVYTFGNGESPFLMGKTAHDFFNDVQESLGSASTQQEYNRLLDFEGIS